MGDKEESELYLTGITRYIVLSHLHNCGWVSLHNDLFTGHVQTDV